MKIKRKFIKKQEFLGHMKQEGSLSWDIEQLSTALKITKDDVKDYFTDGRRASFVIERRIAYEVLHGSRPDSEGEEYDIIDKDGNKWEVRSITKGGIYFCPSNMVGKGRKFNLAGFLVKLNQIKGYIVADITQFPNVPFWIIPKEYVKRWWDSKELGKNSHISKKKALELIQIL